MIQFNTCDTRTPRHLQRRAQLLRKEASAELDARKSRALLRLAYELEVEARQSERLRWGFI